MIKKPLKATLLIDGKLCRTIEEVKENFNLVDILREFENGHLAQFAKRRAFEKLEELEAINKNSDLKDIAFKLCELFDIEADEDFLESEVENYKFSKINKKEEKIFKEKEEEFSKEDNFKEDNFKEDNFKEDNFQENYQSKANFMKPSIKTIKIKNAGEILNSSFKFTPIKTNATSDIDLEDFIGNKASSLAIKDGEIFNGLIIKDNFSNIEFENENLRKAYNIANDILLNFLDWKLKELNFQAPEDFKLSEAKFYYFALKNSLSLLEKDYSKIDDANRNSSFKDHLAYYIDYRKEILRNYREEELNKVKEAISAYEKVIEEPNNQILWNNAVSILESIGSGRIFRSGFMMNEDSAGYYLCKSAKDSANCFFRAFIDNTDVVFKSSTSNSYASRFAYIANEASGNSKYKNSALEEKINVIKAIQFKKKNYLQLQNAFKYFVSTFNNSFELTLVDLYSEIENYKNENWELVK